MGGDGREVGGASQFMFGMVLLGLKKLLPGSPFSVVPLLIAMGNAMTKEESLKNHGKKIWDSEKHCSLQRTTSELHSTRFSITVTHKALTQLQNNSQMR
jgi:hypothetical protein